MCRCHICVYVPYSMHATIKLTGGLSNNYSVAFLDMKLILKAERIVTDLFTKPADTHQYLHERSFHACIHAIKIPLFPTTNLCHIFFRKKHTILNKLRNLMLEID